MSSSVSSRHGFVAFYRQYTKTWLHALATAALTAFGMLTFVHRGFAIVAVTAYVIPPIVLYLRESDGRAIASSTGTDSTVEEVAETGSSPTAETASEPTNGDSDRPASTANNTDHSHDAEADTEKPRWTAVRTPTETTLFDAVVTDAGAFAVGQGGVLLADDAGTESDSDWGVVLEDGPGAKERDLFGVDATDGAVWFVGDGGSLGRLDAESRRHTDYSAPAGLTDNWTDIAVAGTSDDATILLANGAGQVLRGRFRDGDLALDDPQKPGSGSSICAVAFADQSVGYCCDTNDSVFETTDEGESFRRIGIESVGGTLTDIGARTRSDCAVTDDAGVLHRYDDGNWTPKRLGDSPLRSLAWGEFSVACEAGGGVHERDERADSTAEWERITTTAESLHGAAVGSERAIAVGEEGAVVVRPIEH